MHEDHIMPLDSTRPRVFNFVWNFIEFSFSFSFFGARWGSRPQVNPSPVSCLKRVVDGLVPAYQMNTTGKEWGSGWGR